MLEGCEKCRSISQAKEFSTTLLCPSQHAGSPRVPTFGRHVTPNLAAASCSRGGQHRRRDVVSLRVLLGLQQSCLAQRASALDSYIQISVSVSRTRAMGLICYSSLDGRRR